MEEVVSASIACARKAAETTGACVALDIGPLGELLVPAGTLAFEDAYNEFAQVIRAVWARANLVFLETMTDLYELKAAILAARENCDLPVFTSMSFESRGRTFTGCTVESYAVTAAGLGADAVGINCSLGPKEILPFAQRLCRSVPAGVPVFVKPNAGLPNPDGSYNLNPDEFAAEMKEYAAIGVSMVGGCCGTTPAFIARLHETFSPLTPADKIPHPPQLSVHAGPLCGGRRHHCGGGAHQSHRQKAAAAGPAGRRQRLPLHSGCGPGRGRCAGARRQRGPARHRRGRHAGAACRVIPEAVTDLPLQLDSESRGPVPCAAHLQRQTHRQLDQR